MTNESPLDSGANSAAKFQSENIEELETTGDHHRMAAQHFSAAAKHHLLAAAADDDSDDEVNARHAYLAYRHQLTAVQYAEIAVMDNESSEDEFDNEVVDN